ncbi:hypothetical protein KC853_02670, partial [Candidatus Saccharibacteria bacterium]|nr:hypothetical protein [Candidatus Saccharibacteria bacterium]
MKSRLLIFGILIVGVFGLMQMVRPSLAGTEPPTPELSQEAFDKAFNLEPDQFEDFKTVYGKSEYSPFYAKVSPATPEVGNLCWKTAEETDTEAEPTQSQLEDPEYQQSLEDCQDWLISLNPYLAREIYRDYLKTTDWFKGSESLSDNDLIYGKMGVMVYCQVLGQDYQLSFDDDKQKCLESITDYDQTDEAGVCKDLEEFGYNWEDQACKYSLESSDNSELDQAIDQLDLDQNSSADAGGGPPAGKVLGRINASGECEVDNPILQWCPPVVLDAAAPTGTSVSGLGTEPRKGIPDPPRSSEISNKPDDLGERERPVISIKKYVGHTVDDLSDAQDSATAVKFYPGQSIVYQV